ARGVSYCASCDGAFFNGKITTVVGGGDTALSDALLLSKICKKVYLVHRREEFRGAKYLQESVKASENIEIIKPAVPIKIMGENLVKSIMLKFADGRVITIETDGVFAAVGMKPNNLGLNGLAETDKNGYVIADETGVTSVKGLFVAGDVRTKAFRQVVTAVSDGANCVMSAENYLLSLK
ncbi:MAG: FAD-dependent oxidoreductase, partial [Ruminococcus sp.]|nr:FAD-dependent oxidoreductase [Ruminococcus sp.]